MATETRADLVLHNGVIHTLGASTEPSSAIAVAGDRVLAVGSDSDMLRLGRPGVRRIDLEGRTVVPGLIDSHGHILNLGLSLLRVDLREARTYDEAVALTSARASSTAESQWVCGGGWDDNRWPARDLPRHEPLSRAIPFHPVWLRRVCGHAGLANAEAMRLAGVTRRTPDPPGGRIVRDPNGEPTGLFLEAAQELVARRIPPPIEEVRRQAVSLAAEQCLRHGLTTVHDAGVAAGDVAIYRGMIDAGRLRLRIYAMLASGSKDEETGARSVDFDAFLANGPLIDYGNRRLTVRCVKTIADGSLGARSAAMLEPYSDVPCESGVLRLDREDLLAVVRQAVGAGFQVATHAIGDRANRLALDAYEQVQRELPAAGDLRLRIEHAQILDLADIPRFARLGVVAAMQSCHAMDDMGYAEARLGPGRLRGAYAWRRMIDAGARLANGSDFPVVNLDPIYGFHCAVNRQDKAMRPAGGWLADQRMTRMEALRSYTIEAAWAGFEESIKGSLEPGKLADLVVLTRDILTAPAEEILETRVAMTIVGGEVVCEE